MFASRNVFPRLAQASRSVITQLSLNHQGQTRNFFTIIPEYQRGIKLNLGKFSGVVEPGIRLNVPVYHQIYHVDMRDRTVQLQKQKVVTSNNVSYEVDGVLQYRIVDPRKAILEVNDIHSSIVERAQLEMKKSLAKTELDKLSMSRDEISSDLIKGLLPLEDKWGVKFQFFELREITFDDTLKRAMATVAEAELQAKAKVINAKADIETAKEYQKAAAVYSENPNTMRLREFQLWQTGFKDPATKFFVIPSNLLDFMKKN
jgi:regulator of protease activity HflC (stomatin/prohibitin superfamily)